MWEKVKTFKETPTQGKYASCTQSALKVFNLAAWSIFNNRFVYSENVRFYFEFGRQQWKISARVNVSLKLKFDTYNRWY